MAEFIPVTTGAALPPLVTWVEELPSLTLAGTQAKPPPPVSVAVPACPCLGCEKGYYLPPFREPATASTNIRRQSPLSFGLEDFALPEACVDFYLLMEMSLDPLPGVLSRYRKHAAFLAKQLCLYLELASLGEFRHAINDGDLGAIRPTRSRKGIVGEILQRLWLARYHGTLDFRMASWAAWAELHERYGTDLHKALSYGFRNGVAGSVQTGQNGGVGGPRWASCIETALAYRLGGYSDVLFVDLAFGLKHNNSVAYNKFWLCGGLESFLDWAREGSTIRLEHYASPDVQALYIAWRKGHE